LGTPVEISLHRASYIFVKTPKVFFLSILFAKIMDTKVVFRVGLSATFMKKNF
jgi:hypothetical protein